MIKKFFHNLNAIGVSYILISRQATVLYGASAFSEDIDLWVEPEAENWNKFLQVINELKNMKQKNQLLVLGTKPPDSVAE